MHCALYIKFIRYFFYCFFCTVVLGHVWACLVTVTFSFRGVRDKKFRISFLSSIPERFDPKMHENETSHARKLASQNQSKPNENIGRYSLRLREYQVREYIPHTWVSSRVNYLEQAVIFRNGCYWFVYDT